MPQYSPLAWVEQQQDTIAKALEILGGIKLEGPLHNVGQKVLHNSPSDRLDGLAQGKRLQLVGLLDQLGFFAGNPAPANDVPDYTLVCATQFDHLIELFPEVIGQNVVCIASSRTRSEGLDGSAAKFARLEQQFAHTKWCQWANSPDALRLNDSFDPAYIKPHHSLFGIAALAAVVASNGALDWSRTIPNRLANWRLDTPMCILLEGTPRNVTILAHHGTGRSEYDDLRFWTDQLTQNRFSLSMGTVVRLVTRAVSATRLKCLAAQTILTAQPDCHVDVAAARVPQENHYGLTSEALQELATLLSMASKQQ